MTATVGSAEQIQSLLSAAVADGRVPGVAAMAGNAAGTTYTGAFGSRTGSEPFTPDTVTWLASTTKAIVAVAALQCVERGELDLDAPMGELLPQLAAPQVLEGFDDDGTPRIRQARTPMTLRHLLSHTAGYGYHFWNADVLRYQGENGIPNIIECRDATLATPLTFDPGTAWQYGMNIDWAAKAVEEVSGRSIGDYLRDNVLDPLGMRDTTFTLSAEHRTRLAGMSARTPDGLVAIEFEIPQEPEFQMGGGGMYGSPSDYLRFLRMLLRRGELDGARILAPETVDMARRNQIGDLTVGRIPTVDPASSYDVDFLPGTTKKWSLLGMLNVERTPAGRSAGSLFWAGLCNSYYWVDWDADECGLIVTQILPFADPVVLDLFDRFEDLARAL
ncbi:serine hydrolase domain-containing protein [Pseudonocardia endophytica]|uniref:CubicO group peptidase (Beta-lactamase class C family) n=1 Tax=Pseudonocardia endophytica TaxID=401976 RepID=A0A4R1HWY4_PSEEN|nr:serine hydrolase domain-containing protein [Pseudonocardia endophytica]TCK27264.1 CubicO group peptidase (beta-lactamase class C family) [Pseudonocardia endophytica]